MKRPKGATDVTTIANERRRSESSGTVVEVVLGVDTHLDFHLAVAVDHLGRRLGESSVPTTVKGYEKLLCWAEGFGPVRCAGVEGTSSYGAGLARHLRAMAIPVMEVERPKRRHLRRKGKSDPIDAEIAARMVLAGEAAGVPKSADGRVEMIRTLRSARHSAVKARSQAANQLQGFVVTAPEKLRHRLRELTTKKLVAVAVRMRPGEDLDGVETATKFALRSVARRYQALSREIAEGDRRARCAPRSLGRRGSPRADLPSSHRYGSRRDALADRGRQSREGE
jgi:transposase